jgi:predicted nucleotidyltransferase
MSDKAFLEKVKIYLLQKYDCHTIILYGSYSRGDFTEESDVDIVCFSDAVIEDKNDTAFFEGKPLDVWVYQTEKMKNHEQFLRLHKGEIWLNEKGAAQEFLSKIKDTYDAGPQKLSDEEKDFLKSWLRKMFVRSRKDDIEGNYRFHWMLKDSLEIYFDLKGLWYLGPKLSFTWLRENDGRAYELFRNALSTNALQADIEQLIDYINGI